MQQHDRIAQRAAVSIDYQATHDTRGIVHHRARFEDSGGRSLCRIGALDEKGRVAIADHQEFEPQVGIEALDSEHSERTGPIGDGAFAAIRVTARAVSAVALSDTGVIDHDGGVLQRLAESIGNSSGECEALGGERARGGDGQGVRRAGGCA